MASTQQRPLRIGYVPEHYLLPLHLCKEWFSFPVELIPFPSGTGHMITSLRSGIDSERIDLAIGLTEGWVAGLLNAAGRKEKGYTIVGSWVENPLRWSIVTGRNRENINSVRELMKNRTVGVSRLGSGSHVMAFVLAQREGWVSDNNDQNLKVVPIGPFKDLRDGVTGLVQGHGQASPKADFFMWEHFTTKPFFHDTGDGKDTPPLKWIGEIYTPWPSWHIAASAKTFPHPETDERLAQVFEAFDKGVAAFNANTEEAITLLETGELGCHYTEEDAREWLKSVKFFTKTRGVDKGIMDGVVKVLQSAGVIPPTTQIEAGDGVIGVGRE